jgi:hypothetical protein
VPDRLTRPGGAAFVGALLVVAGCAGHSATVGPGDASDDVGSSLLTPVDATAAWLADVGAGPADAGYVDAGAVDAPPLDARLGSDRFVTHVVSFTQGTCAGFGAASLPGVVYGPPEGAGTRAGSLDVVSLGGGGSIVVSFGANAIVDGPGPDFIVFENPFFYGSDLRYAEPGEVAVSEDGMNWTAFPCTDTTQDEPDGGWGATRCAGINPVLSNSVNGISPFDVAKAGGDAYDLAELGLTRATYVRIRNVVASEACPDAGPKPDMNGFDLDAVAIVNAAIP